MALDLLFANLRLFGQAQAIGFGGLYDSGHSLHLAHRGRCCGSWQRDVVLVVGIFCVSIFVLGVHQTLCRASGAATSRQVQGAWAGLFHG